MKNDEQKSKPERSREAFLSRLGQNMKLPLEEKLQALRKTVSDDPESAAEIVHKLCRESELDPKAVLMAELIAGIYNEEFSDDSLVQVVNDAPWARHAASSRKNSTDVSETQLHRSLGQTGQQHG